MQGGFKIKNQANPRANECGWFTNAGSEASLGTNIRIKRIKVTRGPPLHAKALALELR